MKKFLSVAILFSGLSLAGCNERETGVVVDADEAAKYNIPEGAMEKAIAEQMEAAKANKKAGK